VSEVIKFKSKDDIEFDDRIERVSNRLDEVLVEIYREEGLRIVSLGRIEWTNHGPGNGVSIAYEMEAHCGCPKHFPPV